MKSIVQYKNLATLHQEAFPSSHFLGVNAKNYSKVLATEDVVRISTNENKRCADFPIDIAKFLCLLANRESVLMNVANYYHNRLIEFNSYYHQSFMIFTTNKARYGAQIDSNYLDLFLKLVENIKNRFAPVAQEVPSIYLFLIELTLFTLKDIKEEVRITCASSINKMDNLLAEELSAAKIILQKRKLLGEQDYLLHHKLHVLDDIFCEYLIKIKRESILTLASRQFFNQLVVSLHDNCFIHHAYLLYPWEKGKFNIKNFDFIPDKEKWLMWVLNEFYNQYFTCNTLIFQKTNSTTLLFATQQKDYMTCDLKQGILYNNHGPIHNTVYSTISHPWLNLNYGGGLRAIDIRLAPQYKARFFKEDSDKNEFLLSLDGQTLYQAFSFFDKKDFFQYNANMGKMWNGALYPLSLNHASMDTWSPLSTELPVIVTDRRTPLSRYFIYSKLGSKIIEWLKDEEHWQYHLGNHPVVDALLSIFSRIESPEKIEIWYNLKKPQWQVCLPRLGLNFISKEADDHTLQFYCLEHPGYFLSESKACPITQKFSYQIFLKDRQGKSKILFTHHDFVQSKNNHEIDISNLSYQLHRDSYPKDKDDIIFNTVDFSFLTLLESQNIELNNSADGLQLIYICICCNDLEGALQFIDKVNTLGGIAATVQDLHLIKNLFTASPLLMNPRDNLLSNIKSKPPQGIGVMIQVANMVLNIFLQNKLIQNEDLKVQWLKEIVPCWRALYVQYQNEYRHIPIRLRINEASELYMVKFLSIPLDPNLDKHPYQHIFEQNILRLKAARASYKNLAIRPNSFKTRYYANTQTNEIKISSQEDYFFKHVTNDMDREDKFEPLVYNQINFISTRSIYAHFSDLIKSIREGKLTIDQVLVMIKPYQNYILMICTIAEHSTHPNKFYINARPLKELISYFVMLNNSRASISKYPTILPARNFLGQYTGGHFNTPDLIGNAKPIVAIDLGQIDHVNKNPDLPDYVDKIILNYTPISTLIAPLKVLQALNHHNTLNRDFIPKIKSSAPFVKNFLETVKDELKLGQALVKTQCALIEQAKTVLTPFEIINLQEQFVHNIATYTGLVNIAENNLREAIDIKHAPLDIQIKVTGESIKRFDINDLFNMYITRDISRHSQYFSANQERAVTLYQKTHEFLIKATHLQYLIRVKKALDQFCLGQKTDADYKQIYTLLTTKQAYDLSKHPIFLFFEYKNDLFLRPTQIKTVLSVIEQAHHTQTTGHIYKLIMGEGKTSVILPLLLYCLAHLDDMTKRHMPIAEVPKALLKTVIRNTQSTMMRVFSYRGFVLEFSRSSPHLLTDLQQLYRGLKNTYEEQRYVITSPESPRALALTFLELSDNICVAKDAELKEYKSEERERLKAIITTNTTSIKQLQKILRLLDNHGHALIDEVQECLKINYELNYSMLALTKLPLFAIDAIFYILELMRSIRYQNRLTVFDALELNVEFSPKDISLIINTIAHYVSHNILSAFHPLDWIINQFSSLEKQQLYDYVLSHKELEPEFLSQMTLDTKNTVTLFRHLLTDILPSILLRKHRKNYGFRLAGPVDINWEKFCAIPFEGSNKPQLTSEYFDPIQMAMLSAISAIKTNFSSEYIDTILTILYNQEEALLSANPEELLKGGQYSIELKKILSAYIQAGSAFSLKHYVNKEKDLRYKTIAQWKSSNSFINFILKYGILNKQEYHKGIMRCNAHNHASLYAYVDSFTATVNPHSVPRMKMNLEVGRGVDGQIFQTLLIKNPVIYSNAPTAPAQFFKFIVDNDPLFYKLQAILDCGALFTGIENADVASLLLAEIKENSHFDVIKYVLYFDHTDTLCALALNDPATVISVGTTKFEEMKTLLQCSEKNWFVYLDEVHNTGVDLKFASNAHACVTVNRDNQFPQFAQSTLRMRDYFHDQTTAIYLCPNMNSYINADAGIVALKNYLLENYVEDMLTQNFHSFIQAIENIIWKFVFKKLLYSDVDYYYSAIYACYRHFFITMIGDNFHEQYGGIKCSDSPVAILNLFYRASWDKFEKTTANSSLFNSSEMYDIKKQMESLVNDAGQYCRTLETYYRVNSNASPYQFNFSFNLWGKDFSVKFSFSNRAVEVQQQAQVQKQQQREMERQRMLNVDSSSYNREQDLSWVLSPAFLTNFSDDSLLPIVDLSICLSQQSQFAAPFHSPLKFSKNYLLISNYFYSLEQRKPIQSVLIWGHDQFTACVISEKESEVILKRFRQQNDLPFALYHPHGGLKCGTLKWHEDKLLHLVLAQINFINVDFRALQMPLIGSLQSIKSWLVSHKDCLQDFLNTILLRQYNGLLEVSSMHELFISDRAIVIPRVDLPSDDRYLITFSTDRKKALLELLRTKSEAITSLVVSRSTWQTMVTRENNLMAQQKALNFLIKTLEDHSAVTIDSYLHIRQQFPQAFEGWGMDSFETTVAEVYNFK